MFFRIVLLVGVLGTNTLMAEAKIIFALNNQYLSETISKEKSEEPIDGPMIGARYDTGDVIISTNLSRWTTGVLGVIKRHNDGFIIVDIKQPSQKWTISTNHNLWF